MIEILIENYLENIMEIRRLERATNISDYDLEEFNIVVHPYLKFYCKISGSSDNSYIVAFNEEDNSLYHNCPDHKKRHNICKHIAKILLVLPWSLSVKIFNQITSNHDLLYSIDSISEKKIQKWADSTFPQDSCILVEQFEFLFDWLVSLDLNEEDAHLPAELSGLNFEVQVINSSISNVPNALTTENLNQYLQIHRPNSSFDQFYRFDEDITLEKINCYWNTKREMSVWFEEWLKKAIIHFYFQKSDDCLKLMHKNPRLFKIYEEVFKTFSPDDFTVGCLQYLNNPHTSSIFREVLESAYEFVQNKYSVPLKDGFVLLL